MTRKTARVLEAYTLHPRPAAREYHLSWPTVAGILSALVAVGALLGYWITPAATIPVCQEDETISYQGQCVALDDADYVGGIGWVRVK